MNDQNVKMKTSSIPPELAQSDRERGITDSYQRAGNAPERPSFGPGNSGYNPADPRNSQWRNVTGGTARTATIPGLEIEYEDILGGVVEASGEFCENQSSPIIGYGQRPYQRGPARTRFQSVRMFYESPDLTNHPDYDLRQNLPTIIRFTADMEPDYMRRYYDNRIRLINDLLEHTEDELANNVDPRILHARHEFHTELLRRRTTAMKELAKVERYARRRES